MLTSADVRVRQALDRIDQRRLPLDNSYSFVNTTGSGIQIYMLDT